MASGDRARVRCRLNRVRYLVHFRLTVYAAVNRVRYRVRYRLTVYAAV